MAPSKRRNSKRKKKAVGVATPPVPDEARTQSALVYLRLWSSDRERWLFKKKLQYWLLNNAYNKEKIGKSDFKILLKYLVGLQGFHRSRMIQEAHETIQRHKQEETASEDVSSSSRRQCKRAIKILKYMK